ncbi:MAG: glycosyltransferase [Rhodobacterales bacterium]|nr:glycosyltransferase [Rhodobacterales bacterium]
MRWLILTDDYPPLDGGVATWTQGAARGLAMAGHKVTVLCRHHPGLTPDPLLEVVGVGGPSFGKRGAWWLALRSGLRLTNVDAVLASTWNVATVVGPLLKPFGIPLHVVAHGSDVTRVPKNPARRQRLFRGAKVWAVSRFLVGELAEIGVDAQWIPSPVEIAPVVGDRSGPWGVVARATPLKGVERVLRVMAAADVRGVVVGGGRMLPSWKQLAEDLGVSVSFYGAVSRERVREIREGWALSILTPHADTDGTGKEGFGLVLLESIAQGVPAVGCDLGGVTEAVSPHGLVLTDPDDASVSAEEIRTWLSVDTGQRSRQWLAETHGVERLVRTLIR